MERKNTIKQITIMFVNVLLICGSIFLITKGINLIDNSLSLAYKTYNNVVNSIINSEESLGQMQFVNTDYLFNSYDQIFKLKGLCYSLLGALIFSTQAGLFIWEIYKLNFQRNTRVGSLSQYKTP